MLAVNFHLMGGMPVYIARPALDEAPSRSAAEVATAAAVPPRGVASEARSGVIRGPDAPAEVMLRRPVALQVLLSKVRENLL